MDEIKFVVVRRTDLPQYARLHVECKLGREGICKVSLGPVAIGPNQVWQWDGNVERPTISPSINCHGGCGRHYTVINGIPVQSG